MKIYLLGYFGSGAWADDLIGLVTRDLLRDGLPVPAVIHDRTTHPCPASGPAAAEFLNGYDLVLFCGGSLLGRLRLPPLCAPEGWIDRLRVPLVILGTGWRAERRPLSDAELDRMRCLLDRAAAVYVRGELTAARLRQLTDKAIHPIGDPGLALTPSPPHFLTPSSSILRVGVVVREMEQVEIDQDPQTIPNARFQRRLAELLDWLIDGEGAEIVFCPMTPPDRAHDNDAIGIERVRRLMRRGEPCPPPQSSAAGPRGAAECLGRCDLVISQRLHGTLASIAQGVPVVPIEYQFAKMADALSVPGFERLRALVTPAAVLGVDAWKARREELLDPELVRADLCASAAVRARYLDAIAGLWELCPRG